MSATTPLARSARERFGFQLLARDAATRARAGVFTTPHGDVPTPAFMPVGTRGTVKGVFPRDLREVGSTMILANTYHLHLRPGEDVVRALGGLHRFMAWDGPILTDSGGYQVFSLKEGTAIDDDGVTLRSIVDGALVRFTPERVIEIEAKLGADVAMAFDHCPSVPTDRAECEGAVRRTHDWLARCVTKHRELGGEARDQALFGIVQGGVFEDLRRRSVDSACSHDLVGYAVGGVSVGEEREQMRTAIDIAAPLLPEDKPRYLMGVGTPQDFFDAIERGIDLFDCVTPTRHARNHNAFTASGRVNLRNAAWREDVSPLDPTCDCTACTQFSRGTLRHLCQSNEMLAGMLLTLHNLRYFHRLMADIRHSIHIGSFLEFKRAHLSSSATDDRGTNSCDQDMESRSQ
ncbi:MAG: tRNA guanosine(34) transglycosylase Tgt [Planctomycetota bacterium]|nr:tRNA guanosine(34) transglycosylase Tgt [Planctomycetota bacterium]